MAAGDELRPALLTKVVKLYSWSVLGMSKCSVRTSVSVRRRALSMLLGHGVLGHEPHGVLGHEPLSVCEVA